MTKASKGPAALFDKLMDMLDLKNDAALARTLQVAPPVISKVRHQHMPMGASMRLRIVDVTACKLTPRDIREALGEAAA